MTSVCILIYIFELIDIFSFVPDVSSSSMIELFADSKRKEEVSLSCRLKFKERKFLIFYWHK
jgi:hypothetical protein